jgi:2-keto-4-pentenoate hydratase/2-oxohepta-3-ene-1,7-dioic acid hydratase in catechol pathway
MKIVRFAQADRVLQGTLVGDEITVGKERFPLDAVRLLAPCVPTKVVCLGRNYAEHAKELGNVVPERPMFFFKPPSAVIGPEEDIVLPRSPRVDYEAELGVVIGRRARNVRAKDAPDVILGYTCLNDVSDRDAQSWEKNWVRAKGFDTSAPIGPVIVTRDEIGEPFHITLRLNGTTKQDGSTKDLIVLIPQIIEELTAFMTLEPGDVIATGTPAGVGPLSPGDLVEVEIDGIGVLRNRTRASPGEV